MIHCQTVTPRWRHTLHNTWQSPWDASVTLTWRFLSKVGQDNNDPNPLLYKATYGGYDVANRQIPNFSYFDLFASWQAMKQLATQGGRKQSVRQAAARFNKPLASGRGPGEYVCNLRRARAPAFCRVHPEVLIPAG